MAFETLHAALDWQARSGVEQVLEITFHGGEPLTAGSTFYRQALPLLREALAPRRVRLAMQSNLWLLNPELCDLFREHSLAIGTSLDGPENITDAQRGAGYFRRTMTGIELAHRRGLEVGCICTFTRQSRPHAAEIFNFFRAEGLNFSIHAAVPSLQYPDADGWSLSPNAHGDLLVEILDRYTSNLPHLRISTLDSLCKSVSAGEGTICSFTDCLGNYLAVGPDGTIYPCQRFAGLSQWGMGNVHNRPSLEGLHQSPVWRTLAERQERILAECSGCPSLAICKGGCPYNALAANGGQFNGTLRDPHCPGYRRIFAHISDRALAEVFSEENLSVVVERPDPQRGLLRKGQMLSLMSGGPHPYESARYARRLLAGVALAAFSPEEADRRLHATGVLSSPSLALPALQALDSRLKTPPSTRNNLYFHVTFDCNLCCTHCYADAGDRREGYTAPQQMARAVQAGDRAGFRHAVITGGEPLCHPERDALLDALAGLHREKGSRSGILTVLRTNLCVAMDEALLRRVAFSTDQVVVSLDGDEETHDARRGVGTYAATVANLRRLVALRDAPLIGCVSTFTGLSLATVLPLAQANEAPGESVRALARELGIRRTRFRPLLPLGRAVESALEIIPETQWGQLGVGEALAYGFSPTASCGMGENLYIEPDGAAYPCYAWHTSPWLLGNVYTQEGLDAILASDRFRDLARHTVDTNHRCQDCPLRYLCGGACRAWSRLPGSQQTDLDAPPRDCSHLYERARGLLLGALNFLAIDPADWQNAGLPGIE
jgi:uncharacterized protein